MKYIVYLTTNLINNKIYIGVHKTENPDIFDGYIGCGIKINELSKNKHPKTSFQFAVKKYGAKHFKRITLKVFDTLEEALNLEKELVDEKFLQRSDVYNMILGGGETPDTSKKIYQYSLDGKFIKEFKSVKSVESELGYNSASVSEAALRKGSSYSYFWSYDYTETLNLNEYNSIFKGTVFLYDSNSLKYVREVKSISDLSKELKCSDSVLSRAIKGKYSVQGYYLSFEKSDKFIKISMNLKNKKIYQYSVDGNFIKEFQSVNEIREFFNIKSTSGLNVALRTGRLFKNSQWRLDKYDKISAHETYKNIKKIGKFDKDGNCIEIFNSVNELRKKYKSGGYRNLKGQTEFYKDFKFKYI